MEAAAAANTRGCALMEQQKEAEFAKAETEFAEAARLAPDWLAPRINRGIALFNQNTAAKADEARAAFAEVLARDPDNPHAHFCLGIITSTFGPFAEAFGHFEAVSRRDPRDPHAWLRMGLTHPNGPRSPDALRCFEQALALNPYLNAARYQVALSIRAADPNRAAALDAERDALIKATWEAETDIRYGVMGKYADAIGRDPALAPKPQPGELPLFETTNLAVTLAPAARWATAADLDADARALRDRFGGTVVLCDFDRDGRPDVFLASAVVEGGQVRDVLLRNAGNNTFAEVPLPGAPRSVGAAAGDYDNDGKPDLALTSAAGARLLRNRGDGFEDATAALGPLAGAFRGCGWLDVDQDGDLDLLLCSTADGLLVLENVGVAEPGAARLTTAFRRTDAPGRVAAQTVLAADLDSDRDADLLALADGGPPAVIENDRLMRFKRPAPGWLAGRIADWNGGLVLDANHDERSDLLLLRANATPLFLLSSGDRDFAPGTIDSPPLKHAVAADVDMDGWPDVVGLAAGGKPVLLHNRADGSLRHSADAFGPTPVAAHAVATADLTGDGLPDLLTWTDSGLTLFRSRGNGNAAVLVDPTGKRDKGSDMRTNADGIGAWVVAQAGTLWTGAERTTTSAGLGQSLLPTALGIGKRDRADAARVRWPDAVIQAELDTPANAVVRLVETNRKGTSCPVLMAWDGERFAFVTDFLGGGALGESGPDGAVRPPRGEESVKIEAKQLVAKDGRFFVKIAEPMDEVLYLDHLRLDVVDQPPGVEVYPDERFVFAGPPPTQKLLRFPTQHAPVAATDHRGRDVLPHLLARDRRAVDGFARRSWLGYAEDHFVTLDFGPLPAGKWHLVLAGWTEYPYPESMYAATRAGVALKPPALERKTAAGAWEPLLDLGFPAGLPRVMTRELPPDFRGGSLRISTNMQVFWDRIYAAPADDTPLSATPLSVSRATLTHRGFMQEVHPGGRPPVAYDDAKTEPVAVTRWKGHLTRPGDVTELLRAADDRFVLCGPGDEITVAFDAALPPLPAGWERTLVLRTHGYCKDTSTTTVTGGQVGPLPFRAMPNYPHFGAAKPPATDADEWHTRPAGGR